jgi:GNAT superfamily N-acetyltransferase
MTNDYTIRRAVPADADLVRDLTRAAYAKYVPLIGREPLPMAADYQRAVREHLVDLLHVDGKLAGLIEMIDEGEQLLVENVAIADAFQGRGLGVHLLAHADRTAARLGRPRLRLYTNRLFGSNVDYYLRRGYAIDREEAVNGGTVVHMSKPTPPVKPA